MARLPLVDPDDPGTDPETRELLLRARAGNERRDDIPWRDVNVTRALANHVADLGIAETGPLRRRLDGLVALRPCLGAPVNRFHATFLTDLDDETAACPIPDLVAEAAQRGWKRSTGSAD